jgi:hypothetical protein
MNGKQGRRILAFLTQCVSENEHPEVKEEEPYYKIRFKDTFSEAYYMEDVLGLFRALATSRKNKMYLC